MNGRHFGDAHALLIRRKHGALAAVTDISLTSMYVGKRGTLVQRLALKVSIGKSGPIRACLVRRSRVKPNKGLGSPAAFVSRQICPSSGQVGKLFLRTNN